MEPVQEKEKFSLKGLLNVFKSTFGCFSDDNITKLSGSLAYYTVFSMGPLLVVIISLCGVFLGKDAAEGKIYAVLRDFVGADTAIQLQEIIRNAGVSHKSPIAATIGIVTLLFGATTVFAEIQDSINAIWGLKAKPKRGWLKMLQNRLLSFSIIISLGFLLLVSLAVSGVVEGISGRLQEHFKEVSIVTIYVINLTLTLGISTTIFAVIFKVLPDANIRWKDVLAGALVTSGLFLLGKFAISFYISQTAVGSTFGTAGSLVVLLVWVYYSSMILYLGAEFTKAWALRYGEEIHPNSYAVTVKQVEVDMGKQTIQEKEQHEKHVKAAAEKTT